MLEQVELLEGRLCLGLLSVLGELSCETRIRADVRFLCEESNAGLIIRAIRIIGLLELLRVIKY